MSQSAAPARLHPQEPPGGARGPWHRLFDLIAGAAIAGALVGLSDALLVSRTGTLAPDPGRDALLVLADFAVTSFGVALIAVPLAVLAAGCRARRWPVRWAGFLAGLAMALLADFAGDWFTAPPSFARTSNWHGHPAVFAAAVLVAGGLVAAGTHWGRRPVVRGRVGLLVIAVLFVRPFFSGRHIAKPAASPPDGAPNVLLVTLDTSRADHFGVYGSKTCRTPHFDALARGGVLFREAFSQIPVTGPSHLTILSGLGPWTHGNLLNGIPIPPDIPTLPEILHQSGWRTGAFVSAYVLDGKLGYSQGFEVYDDDFAWLQGWGQSLPGRLEDMVVRHFNPDRVVERRGGLTVDKALSWLDHIEGRPKRPFFMWVHLFDPHGPYAPPPPWDTAYYSGDPRDPAHRSMAKVHHVAPYLLPYLRGITDVNWVLAQYAGEVSYADEQLGRLLQRLDDDGVAKNTLVVVLGDHGEDLGEHDVWFNHGDNLYDESVAVPLAIRMPGKLPAGRVVNSPVELTDITPTLLDLLQLKGLDSADGRSLVPLIEGEEPSRPFARSLAFDRPANLAARKSGKITKPTYLVASLRGPNSRYLLHDIDGRAEYYDLSTDPGELYDIQPDAELAGMLRQQARALMDALSSDAKARTTQEVDEEMKKKLQALGYMEQ